MSRLEDKSAKILRPMIRAERVGISLPFADQTIVASWATKMAMVCQWIHPSEGFIPTSDYRDFRRKQQPSSNVFVLMGARHIGGNSKGANIFEYKEQFIGKDSIGIQHVHFAVGALYFGVVMFIGRKRQLPERMSKDAAMRTVLVWPLQPKVVWPTPSISEIGGVEAMFGAFAGAYWGF